jgi:hypothetical protein
VPWLPELFSVGVLERLEQASGEPMPAVRYFDGLLMGELDALVESFAGEPEVHHPVRGRVRGARAFTALVADTRAWLAERNIEVENAGRVVSERNGFEEVILHLDGENGRVEVPLAIVVDRRPDRRIEEVRMYFSSWPLSHTHAIRPPLLQPDPDLRLDGVVGDHQRALAAGDVDAVVAAFEPDGYAREPAGGEHVHRGGGELRSLYELLFSNGGGILLEHCAAIDDGHTCALEYNVERWGTTELPPQAGVAVYERGPSDKLAAARMYDDADPPVGG